jgi:hypothetical protein
MQVNDLAPIAGLSRLETLDCHRTSVNDLAAVAASPIRERSIATSHG